jgi:hypothetical protein
LEVLHSLLEGDHLQRASDNRKARTQSHRDDSADA